MELVLLLLLLLTALWLYVCLVVVFARDVRRCFRRGSNGARLDVPSGSCGRFRFRSCPRAYGNLS